MDDRAADIIAELEHQVGQLRDQNEQLRQENERLREENRTLRDQLEEAQRLAARQAAPFRRRQRQKVADDARKRPGRKKGHAGSCRRCPPEIDETHEVPLSCCPKCGGPIKNPTRVEQIIEEIPPSRPRAVKVITYRATCDHCGEVCSRHPLQTSDAQGAAKVQLGPRALALATMLNKVHGLTMRKTCRVLEDMVGLKLTPGGLSQAEDRVARRLEPDYQALIGTIRGSPAVFADETSWWVGGPGWWLWTFTTPQTTVYRVEASRGAAVVQDVLGEDFAGMLVSDCLASYDPAKCRKHKCIAHHLRAIAKAKKLPGTGDPSYLHRWEILLKAVVILYDLRAELGEETFAEKRARLEKAVDELLDEPRSQCGDVAIQNRLRKQRPHLLGCLYEPAAEPTNNRAERSLRPAVIARKVSCGNKTEQGCRTWEVLTSLGTTLRQRAKDFVAFLTSRLPLASQSG
jgi:transposase